MELHRSWHEVDAAEDRPYHLVRCNQHRQYKRQLKWIGDAAQDNVWLYLLWCKHFAKPGFYESIKQRVLQFLGQPVPLRNTLSEGFLTPSTASDERCERDFEGEAKTILCKLRMLTPVEKVP